MNLYQTIDGRVINLDKISYISCTSFGNCDACCQVHFNSVGDVILIPEEDYKTILNKYVKKGDV